MKIVNNDIKRLIDSLTQSEKRQFKLLSNNTNNKKHYVRLFDAIEKQKIYDEETLKKKFPKSFAVAKNYLIESIIDSLQINGSYKDLDSLYSREIEKYKIFLFKGLKNAAKIQLKKIKKNTLEDDAFIKHLYILNQEYVTVFNSDSPTADAELNKVIEERNLTHKIIQNYAYVADVYFRLRLHLKTIYYCKTTHEKKELTTIIKPLLKFNEAELLSNTAKSLYSMAMNEYYSAIGDYEKAINFSGKYLTINRAKKSNAIEVQTLLEIGNYLLLCLKCKRLNNFEKDLIEFTNIMEKTTQHYRYIFCYERWYLLKLKYFHLIKNTQLATLFINEQQLEFDKLIIGFSNKSKAACLYFLAKNYYNANDSKKSLHYCNKIINEIDNKVEEFLYAKLLKLLIYKNEEELQLIDSEARSIINLLKRAGNNRLAEYYLANFIKSNPLASIKEWKIFFEEKIAKVTQKENFYYYIDLNYLYDKKLI